MVGRNFDGLSGHARGTVRADADRRVYIVVIGRGTIIILVRFECIRVRHVTRTYIMAFSAPGGGVVGHVKVGRPAPKLCALSRTAVAVAVSR